MSKLKESRFDKEFVLGKEFTIEDAVLLPNKRFPSLNQLELCPCSQVFKINQHPHHKAIEANN